MSGRSARLLSDSYTGDINRARWRVVGEAVVVVPSGRSHRIARRAGPWIAAGIVLVLLASVGGARGVPFLRIAPAVGYAHAPAANVTLAVQLTDAPAFSPRFLSVAPGSNVTFHFTNTGHLPHTFTLSSQTGVRADPSWTPAQLNQSFAAHPPLLNVSVAAGGSIWANVSILPSEGFDSFQFLSQVPYQFQAGMWGLLNVTSNAPGLTAYENTTNALSFQPAALSASPSHFPVNVDVYVANLGDLSHTFTVYSQANVTVTTLGEFHAHPPLANVTVPSGAGQGIWANFTVPAAGVYEYVCMVAGHFTGGMFGFLYAGVPLPPPPAPESTAVVQTWVLAGSAVLLGIGLLLVVVGAFGGRFPRAPPAH